MDPCKNLKAKTKKAYENIGVRMGANVFIHMGMESVMDLHIISDMFGNIITSIN